jgi:hypothetical protein
LNDKLVENPMEFGAGIRTAVDTFGEHGDKVCHRFRHDDAEKTDFDPSQLFAGYLHVQVRHVRHRICLKLDSATRAPSRQYKYQQANVLQMSSKQQRSRTFFRLRAVPLDHRRN